MNLKTSNQRREILQTLRARPLLRVCETQTQENVVVKIEYGLRFLPTCLVIAHFTGRNVSIFSALQEK